MIDYSELKRLAEAALRNWPDSKLFERPECERFIDATRPDVVLALIAEVEGLRAQHGRDSAELRSLCQARDDARKERDQLKAEVEALRKDAERYRWLRVNEFDIGSYYPEGDNNHDSWFEHFDDQSIDRGIADEAEFAAEAMGRDEIPDFTPGNGNKARRRADELGIDYDAAMSKVEKP